MATFEQKLSYIMTCHKMTNTGMAEYLVVDRSTVSKWLSGDRAFNKDAYAAGIAGYLMEKIDRDWLLSLLDLHEAYAPLDDSQVKARIVEFLFDTKDITVTPIPGRGVTIGREVRNEGCFLGIQGLFDALSLLSDKLGETPSPESIFVYLSSEYCSLLLDAQVNVLWDYLYTINLGRPVKLIFEQWRESGRVTKILQRLLPFIQVNKLELYYIPSTERFFCYNISFLAQDSCMVMTTEPAGFEGSSVSLFVESPEFVTPMSKVLGKLTRLARPMARHILLPRFETARINSFFNEEGDINALFDCVNLLFVSEDGYKELLKSCGILYEQRRIAGYRFARQKEAFEQYLLEYGNREIVSLDAIDNFIDTQSMKIPELSFPAKGRIPVDLSFLKEALEGMIGYLKRYRNLQIVLCRGNGTRDLAWRLKEDRFMLLHCFNEEEKTCMYSENFLIIDQYMNQMEAAFRGKGTVRGKANVISALQNRIDKIGGIQDAT